MSFQRATLSCPRETGSARSHVGARERPQRLGCKAAAVAETRAVRVGLAWTRAPGAIIFDGSSRSSLMSTLHRCLALLGSAALPALLACAPAQPERVDVARGGGGGDVDEARQFVDEEEPAGEPADEDSCAVQRLPLREVQRPIDIIMVLDNSVSMALELDAVERSINRNFADVLDARGSDYRVILLSRHRNAARQQSDEAQTAICVTEPLSSLEACPATRPGQTERFFHYAIDINSTDALGLIVDTFDTPDPLYRVTQAGWGEWLREGSRALFLLFTDDDSLDNGRDFTRQLTLRDPEHFGPDVDTPAFVFHSIIGVAEREPAGTAYGPDEPFVTERCEKNGEVAPSSGRVYQELSRLTGGLRYPLCALDDYAAIFEGIARDGLERSGLACSFPLPAAPAGKRLDTQRIDIVLGESQGDSARIARVEALDACESNAFYVADDQIELCPALCDQLAELPTTTVSVEFDCDSFVDVR
jgi:hypothetical protein